jgi:hypothetical protein
MTIAILGKKIALTMQAVAVAFGFSAFSLAAVTVAATPAHAACSTGVFTLQNGADCAAPTGAKTTLFGTGGIFNTIANTLIFLVGAIAVLFLIIGGLRYVVSNGEPKNVEAAKNTILYAIIGIIVAILSYAAVNFVIGALSK